MKRLFASVAIAAAIGWSATAANAMPFAGHQSRDGLFIQVAGGCGAGWHRGPYGHCRRNGYYGGRYWGAPPGVPVGPGPYPCGGRGQHRVCGPNGCWMVCN
ncbi:MAG TPA: hypothetical protein VJR71_16765 [Pseudolabrys sp.]|nr:hypothetical protein [Pseudolabrys sp.]